MPELKPGDAKTFEIDGQKVIVEPLPFGALKQLLKIVMEVVEKDKAGDAEILSIPFLLNKYADQVIPLLFRKDKHPWLTTAWVDDHMTVPMLREIIETVAVVNGLSHFFGKTATPPAPAAVATTSGTPTTPPENISSTTPSESPMAGGPGKSTS